MAVNEDYLAFINDQLSAFGNYEEKRMFGGVGFFRDGIMFGLIGAGVLRFRVDETTQSEYEEQGMEPLRKDPKKKGMPYWQVPEGVVEDRDELKVWAEKAYKVAFTHKK